mgnify:CR=1 FL=1
MDERITGTSTATWRRYHSYLKKENDVRIKNTVRKFKVSWFTTTTFFPQERRSTITILEPRQEKPTIKYTEAQDKEEKEVWVWSNGSPGGRGERGLSVIRSHFQLLTITMNLTFLSWLWLTNPILCYVSRVNRSTSRVTTSLVRVGIARPSPLWVEHFNVPSSDPAAVSASFSFAARVRVVHSKSSWKGSWRLTRSEQKLIQSLMRNFKTKRDLCSEICCIIINNTNFFS